jgi:hypothetical protein
MFRVDVLACPQCGGRMRLIATIGANEVQRPRRDQDLFVGCGVATLGGIIGLYLVPLLVTAAPW